MFDGEGKSTLVKVVWSDVIHDAEGGEFSPVQ